MAASKGWTVMASAPPIAAPKHAVVVRSMFTHGSRRVIMAEDGTTCCACGCAAPHASVTRAHNRRAARSLAMVEN
jgi:argininosuccinate lyase